MNDIDFIFCSYPIFQFAKEFTKSALSVEIGSFLWDLSTRRSFSLIPSTYGKFVLILIFSFWIFVFVFVTAYTQI